MSNPWDKSGASHNHQLIILHDALRDIDGLQEELLVKRKGLLGVLQDLPRGRSTVEETRGSPLGFSLKEKNLRRMVGFDVFLKIKVRLWDIGLSKKRILELYNIYREGLWQGRTLGFQNFRRY